MVADTPSRARRYLRVLFRWTLRLLLLGGLVWLLFLPWDHDVVGRCRLIPTSQHGVRAAIGGEVLEVRVVEGDEVQAGDVIAVLDDREHRSGLETAEAELARLNAELDLLVAGPREEQLTIARETKQLWEVRLKHYESELVRVGGLAEKNAGSAKDVEQARLARDEALHMLATARESLAQLEAGTREEEIRAKQAEVESARVAIQHHARALELTRVVTPIAGRIVTPFMRERVGQVVAAGELLAVVHDSSSLEAEVAADESAAALAEPDMDVEVRLDGLDGEPLEARVRAVGLMTASEAELDVDPIRSDREGQLESQRGTGDGRRIRVFCVLAPTDHRLVPGMTGYARIEIGTSVLWRELWRPIERFFRTDVWSWLP